MNKIIKRIGEIGIIPVVKMEKPEDALPIARSLIDGDLPVAEITFIVRKGNRLWVSTF